MKHDGLRYNTGKLRYDLIPSSTFKILLKDGFLYDKDYVMQKDFFKLEVFNLYGLWMDGEDSFINTNSEVPILDSLFVMVSYHLEYFLKKGEKSDNTSMPFYAIDEMVKVMTLGAEKYEPRNWERGMSWTQVGASFMRHIFAYLKSMDNICSPYDEETGLHHLAHAMCNLTFLITYYKIYPQGDDRPLKKQVKIGLDIDDVLANFTESYCNKFNCNLPTFWSFDRGIEERLASLDEDFWLNLPPLIDSNELPFEPHCYITSRSVESKVTEKWLDINGFPHKPVYTVGVGISKVESALSSKLDIFVDDRYSNYLDLNQNGVCTYLITRPHNKRYDVGHKRINSLTNLKFLLK